MSQDLNNSLGFPAKYAQSYFRSWVLPGINAGAVYGASQPGSCELVGRALSIGTDDTLNGTRLVCNEAGLYFVAFTIRVNTNTAIFSCGKYNKIDSTTSTLQNGTKDEVAFVNVTATAVRFAASGFVYMVPGDNLGIVTNAANAVSGFSWQVCKISPTL